VFSSNWFFFGEWILSWVCTIVVIITNYLCFVNQLVYFFKFFIDLYFGHGFILCNNFRREMLNDSKTFFFFIQRIVVWKLSPNPTYLHWCVIFFFKSWRVAVVLFEFRIFLKKIYLNYQNINLKLWLFFNINIINTSSHILAINKLGCFGFCILQKRTN